MFLYEARWLLGLACAWTYFMMGRYEARNGDQPDHGLWWAVASLLVTVVVIRGLDAGTGAVVLAQLLVFAAITVWRTMRRDGD